jgi:hypothetical protein
VGCGANLRPPNRPSSTKRSAPNVNSQRNRDLRNVRRACVSLPILLSHSTPADLGEFSHGHNMPALPELGDISSLADLSGAALALVQAQGWNPGSLVQPSSHRTAPNGDIIVDHHDHLSTTAAIEAALASASPDGLRSDGKRAASELLDSDIGSVGGMKRARRRGPPPEPLPEEERIERTRQLANAFMLTYDQAADIWFSCSGNFDACEEFARILVAGDAVDEEEMLGLQNDAVWAEIVRFHPSPYLSCVLVL